MKMRLNVVAAIIRDGERILATQRSYGSHAGKWEFPGGKVEAGETPWRAIKREIHEELNAEIEVGNLLDTIEFEYPEWQLSIDCFWCHLLSEHWDLVVAKDYKWVTKEDMDQLDWLDTDRTILEKIKAEL